MEEKPGISKWKSENHTKEVQHNLLMLRHARISNPSFKKNWTADSKKQKKPLIFRNQRIPELPSIRFSSPLPILHQETPSQNSCFCFQATFVWCVHNEINLRSEVLHNLSLLISAQNTRDAVCIKNPFCRFWLVTVYHYAYYEITLAFLNI